MNVSDLTARRSETPTVSVIMANYNGAEHLNDAIGSVQRQSLRDLEIIVSDDASSDDSVRIVTRLMAKDPRIRLIRSERNDGPATARNRALAVAKGEWIAVMDSDDLMHPERLAKLVAAARRDGADLIADDLLIFSSDGSRPPGTLLTGQWAHSPFWVSTAEYIGLNHLYGAGPALGYLKPVFRASALNASAIRYDERLRIAEDYHLVLHLLHLGMRLRVYPLLLYFYRKHTGSISHRLSENVLLALKAADLRFLGQLSSADAELVTAIKRRLDSIETALAYERLRNALMGKNLLHAIRAIKTNPKALTLLRLPLGVRLCRLVLQSARQQTRSSKSQACILSRQRVIGRTNGSSSYLLDLAAAISQHGFDVNFISPSPTTLGRWPYLTLSSDMSVFRTLRIRGTWRGGRHLISSDPRLMIKGALALVDKFLVNRGWLSQPHFKRAPYSIAQPITREDQLYIARHAPAVGDLLIADYCFLTEALPYALRPNSTTAVIMHDRFSSRTAQFAVWGGQDSVGALTEQEECSRLAQADIIVAIQCEEAEFLRNRLPSHRVIVAPMAAHPIAAAQAGRSDQLLFVASSAAPNVDGIRWFLDSCWPAIRARRHDATFCVAGTVCDLLGPPPEGARFLGFVQDLSPLYRDAGVVVSPLRIGSGLKIKLIEGLERGKAVVATSKTLQGVGHLLADGVWVADNATEFVNAVCVLLEDEQFRVDLATKGLNALAEHFAPETCYGPFLKEIGNLTANRAPDIFAITCDQEQTFRDKSKLSRA
jgi:GT2 family glycosyltransferase/glycosyltransferase involved in cell wall biosynthesis